MLQLVVQRRVARSEDCSNYPSLWRAANILANPRAAQSIEVDPVEVLAYLSQELNTAGFASKTVGPFGIEGLIGIVAALLQAAITLMQGTCSLTTAC